MSGIALGTRYEVDPIPPVPEDTTYLDAGPLRIGVEFRHLTDDVLDAGFAYSPEAAAIVNADRPEQIDDQGFSIHVLDAGTGGEHLRFDMFDNDPHYHYIVPSSYNVLIPYDTDASGDMFEWVLECLRHRLPQMLRHAEADELAQRIAQPEVDRVLSEIERLMGERGRPMNGAAA